MEKKTYYISTPIYYPSANLHIGHCYSTVIADSIARYKKERGYDVFFLTGTDEHGQKIERKAQETGVTPQQYVDKIVADTKVLWKVLGIEYDKFIRTTDEEHKACVTKIFERLYNQGDIYKSEYEGLYCTPCESFYTESQLVDGKCPDCGREVENVKEESYFFKLSKYEERLKKFFIDNPTFLEPESRKKEMFSSFLSQGLTDICVSRTTFTWGIPVSFDPKHIVYVWIDALSNYISALGYLSEDDTNFKKYWPADMHLIGKEITRFHAITWPALLMALDLPLPKKIFSHGWLILGGNKISKSLGNYKDPRDYLKYSNVDSLRYYLLKEVKFGNDGAFSEEMYIEKINADLANDIGNLVSRTVSMVEKYNEGILARGLVNEEIDNPLKQLVLDVVSKVEDHMDNNQIDQAVAAILQIAIAANKYIDVNSPWILAKDEANKSRLNEVLYNLVESIRIMAVLLKPFMIEVPGKIFNQIGVVDESIKTWESSKIFGNSKEGSICKKTENIFMRIDSKEVLKEEVKVEETKKVEVKKEEIVENVSNCITIDQLDKVELKVGKIVKVERIEGSDKLYKLAVEIGEETRVIVSGLVKYYTEEALLNLLVVVVTNLKPAKLRGIESNGMLLAAGIGEVVKLLTIDGLIDSGASIS